MDSLVVLIPLLPFIAAVLIATGGLTGHLRGEDSETQTAFIANWAINMSCLIALTLLGADLLHKNTGRLNLGSWLSSDDLNIEINFITHGFNVILAALFSLILSIILRFSVNYMHREAGFHRFFAILSLFASAMLLLVLSGNAVGTFFGWEIAGLCSYLLIMYAYQRPVATVNATRVFVTNRLGDIGFILGISLSIAWTSSVNWLDLKTLVADLSTSEATAIALCFSLAAFTKSAQVPFTPWLSRAMEGPTPSSTVFYGSVMISAGVYLVCMLEPLFEKAPFAMAVLIVFGAITALHSYWVGLTQTDVKSSLAYATSGQLGLMFVECGLGYWSFAIWHLCAHAIVRCYGFLTAPSLMHNVNDNPIKPINSAIAKLQWAYTASLQRFWLDQLADWMLIRPIRRLAHDLSYFDEHVIDRLMGIPTPAINTISSLAELEERLIGGLPEPKNTSFGHGSGIAGNITSRFASLMHWFEDRFILRGIGKDALHMGRNLGKLANKFEVLVLRPRYLVLFILITVLLAF